MTNEEHVERWCRRERQRGLFFAVLVASPFILYTALGIIIHERTGSWPLLSDMVDSSDREYGRR